MADTKALIDVQKVSSVYIGKDGACCCGCAGKHYYASHHVKAASKNRGYLVGSDEVSDLMVKKVVGILNAAAEVEMNRGHVSTVVGTRVYIAYFVV